MTLLVIAFFNLDFRSKTLAMLKDNVYRRMSTISFQRHQLRRHEHRDFGEKIEFENVTTGIVKRCQLRFQLHHLQVATFSSDRQGRLVQFRPVRQACSCIQ